MVKKINYQSDFKLEVTLTLGGVAMPVPNHDFALVFSSCDGIRKYVCKRIGDVWTNCRLSDDGEKVLCFLDNHGLSVGDLRVKYIDIAPDSEMPDKDLRTVTPTTLDVELVAGAGDGATDIDVDVPTDLLAIIAEINELEERCGEYIVEMEEIETETRRYRDSARQSADTAQEAKAASLEAVMSSEGNASAAISARDNAEDSAQQADAAASSAQRSASLAADSATSASDSRLASEQAAQRASNSAVNADSSEYDARRYANQASASADSARGSAEVAYSRSVNAANSAAIAAENATIAQGFAVDAETSSEAAAASASAASGSATSAANSANSAASSAASVGDAVNRAESAATSAAASATDAAASASAAASVTTMRKQMPAYAICTKGAYYNNSGVLTQSNQYLYAFISLENVTHLNVTGAFSTRVWYFGSDGTTPIDKTTTVDVYASSFPTGAVYAAISYSKTDISNTLTIDYSTIAITDEVEDGNYKYKKITAPTGPWNLAYDTGVQSYNNGWRGVLGFIPVLGADFIFCAQNHSTYGVICFYDENFDYISGLNYCRASKVPANAKYAKIRCSNADVGTAEIYFFEGEADDFDRLAHLERDVALLKPMPMKGKIVAFLGDSITASSTYGLYTRFFAERTGCTLENFGVAGQDYAGGAIAGQAANLTGNEDVVVVMAGTNDFGHNAPIGDIYNVSSGTIVPTTDTSTTCSGVHAVIQGIYAKCPTAKIIIITPPQRATGWTANTQGKFLFEYVNAIKQVAQLYGVLVVDQFSNCNINPVFSAMKNKYFNSDGTHPNPLYHQLLADWLYNAIADWIREPYL